MHIRKSYVCSNQLDVKETNFISHNSTESEIISLDAGLRLDGVPALDLWDSIVFCSGKHDSDYKVVSVLHGNTYQSDQERRNPCTNVVRFIELISTPRSTIKFIDTRNQLEDI